MHVSWQPAAAMLFLKVGTCYHSLQTFVLPAAFKQRLECSERHQPTQPHRPRRENKQAWLRTPSFSHSHCFCLCLRARSLCAILTRRASTSRYRGTSSHYLSLSAPTGAAPGFTVSASRGISASMVGASGSTLRFVRSLSGRTGTARGFTVAVSRAICASMVGASGSTLLPVQFLLVRMASARGMDVVVPRAFGVSAVGAAGLSGPGVLVPRAARTGRVRLD